jgi:Zn-dependent protease with chaperone function
VLDPIWCIGFLVLRPMFYDVVYYPFLACFYPVRFLRNETFEVPGVGKTTLPVYEVKVSHRTRRVDASIRLRGPNSAIYVTDTLIDEFTDGEERVVMAHEFGHLYDQLHLEARTPTGIAQARRKLMLGSAQLLAAALSLGIMLFASPLLGLSGVHDLAGFPMLAGLTLALGTVLSPFLYAEARRDEKDADQYALAITGDISNYLSVMQKLRRMNLEQAESGPLRRFFLDTHPSYTERISLALEYRRRLRPRRRKAEPARGAVLRPARPRQGRR